MLDQAGQPGHELVDHLALEGADAAPIGSSVGLDAPLRGSLDRVHHGGRLQERLRRDAASKQTGSSEALVALHNGHALAELCSSKGAGIAPRSRADDEDVEVAGHLPHSTAGKLNHRPSERLRRR
jgi:hypothetical protein